MRYKSPPPTQPTQARTPAIQAAQRTLRRWPGFAAGATTAKITTAHTTDAGETRNHYRLHNRRRRGRLRSLLCRAPSAMAWLRCGGDCRKITTDCTTTAGEDACYPGFAAGATAVRNHYRPHNRRRRGRLRSLLCRAPKGGGLAAPRGRLRRHFRTETKKN